jgi:hypothetical protein
VKEKNNTNINRLIESKRSELNRLCIQHHVRRLELFGSAAKKGFDPDTSDLDFLVEFKTLSRGQHADAYFGLLEGLEGLFARPIDLLMVSAIKNRFLIESIQNSRLTLYAA